MKLSCIILSLLCALIGVSSAAERAAQPKADFERLASELRKRAMTSPPAYEETPEEKEQREIAVKEWNEAKTKAAEIAADAWEEHLGQSPIDDSETVTLILHAKEEVNINNLVQKTPALVVRLREGKFETYVNFDYPLADGKVLVRYGKSAARAEEWRKSTDSVAIFNPNPRTFAGFLKTCDRLVIRGRAFGGAELTAIFEPSGLKDILPKYPAMAAALSKK